MHVKIVYNPYVENMSIFIDNQPVGKVSALSKYQTLPISMWYMDILNAIAYEVNDNFDLTYVGRMCEYNLLKSVLQGCPNCSSLNYEQPVLGDGTLIRLKKLSRLVMNGVECPNFIFPLHIFSDYAPDVIEHTLKSIIPRLSFCRITVSCHDLSEDVSPCEKHQTMAILSNMIPQHGIQAFDGKAAGVLCAQYQGHPHASVFLNTNASDILKNLEEILELCYYPYILKVALQGVCIAENSAFFMDTFVLDKVEPYTFVKLPKSIETDCTVPVRTTTIPKTSVEPKLTYRISNESVITYTSDGLHAVGTGEAVVEVYEAGKTVPICTGVITAYRTNHIQKLTIHPMSIRMCVGETTNLDYAFSPSDADNRRKIRLMSSNGTIAAVRTVDTIAGQRPGQCSVFYEAEKVRSSLCDVTVFPRLESVDIDMDCSTVQQNTFAKVHILRTPDDATLDKLSVMVEPSYLGTYDQGSGSFFAREPGTGHLVVMSDRNNVKAAIPIKVTKKRTLKIKGILILIGIVAAIFFLRMLMK